MRITDKLGYIVVRYGERTEYTLKEASYERRISKDKDKIYSRMLIEPEDYDNVLANTELIRKGKFLLVREPFFMDEETRKIVENWLEIVNFASIDESNNVPMEDLVGKEK